VARSYAEKLKDPRWQRKRLEVMKRADFACENCGDRESTLNVHHGYYEPGLDPWEYSDNALSDSLDEFVRRLLKRDHIRRFRRHLGHLVVRHGDAIVILRCHVSQIATFSRLAHCRRDLVSQLLIAPRRLTPGIPL